ncbi:MAG: hypothetical protein JSS72_11015 [Armatimonadetes bacterium]|nr:hypothetical protein [Armatimonadota bacterium]
MIAPFFGHLLLLWSAGTVNYEFDALFTEGCSCGNVCAAEITGLDTKCHGISGMQFISGKVGGTDISGAKAAWVFFPGSVELFIDAPKAQQAGVEFLIRHLISDWGKMESVENLPISITSESVMIDSGKVARMAIKPVTGKTGSFVSHGNLASPLHDTIYQGVTKSAEFNDRGVMGRSFQMKETNAYFYPHCKMKGSFTDGAQTARVTASHGYGPL